MWIRRFGYEKKAATQEWKDEGSRSRERMEKKKFVDYNIEICKVAHFSSYVSVSVKPVYGLLFPWGKRTQPAFFLHAAATGRPISVGVQFDDIWLQKRSSGAGKDTVLCVLFYKYEQVPHHWRFWLYVKGEVISKWFLGSSISSKKRTNEFVFTSMRLVFVRFLEEIDDLKKPFRY